MMRNDYRRALILLRGDAPLYSGHVRLERRTLMGSMYFIVQAPQQGGLLRAALVGRNREGYYACDMGDLQRDTRGQAVLGYSFDPRNICGRELEDYRLIAVVCGEGGDCEIVLHGNICGHADLNWESVRGALHRLYCAEVPADEREMPSAQPEAEIETEFEPEALPAFAESMQQEIREEIREEQEEILEDILENDADRPRTAGEILNIDMDVPWPESIEALRPLFTLSVPMENPPDEEYTYIAAAMPPESGYAYSAVGVRTENGAPASVRYGMPARWTAEPPAGLEEYSWVGDGNRGWWMTQIDL